MKRKFTAFIFALLFILSGTIAAYGQCVSAAHHLDSTTEQEAPFIHCPEVALNSSTQVSPLVRSYANDFGKALTSPVIETNPSLAIARFSESTFVKPFFQRDLYQLEEVYRL